MVALDALIVATALADIGRQFDASIESLEWTVNAYTLSFAVLLMTAAAIGDRLGRREVFAAGLAPLRGRLCGLRGQPERRLADRGPCRSRVWGRR